MADVKISQLPAATTPLDGTEVLPIVQSATTKQVSIANVTAGRAMAASSLTLTTPLAVTSGGTGIATAAQGALLSATAADTFSATRTPTLGLAGTAAGTLGLSGSTSGVVTLATAATAGTWTLTLPTTGGTNGYILTTNGAGVSSWTNPTALGIDLDVGTTAITGGTTGRVLYDNAGFLGEYTTVPVGFGGTGTSTAFTAGSVVFAGASGTYSQNNSNFYWDNSNIRLGVGTSSPSFNLQVAGDGANTLPTSCGQIVITGKTNPSQQMMLGYDTTNNYGYIQPTLVGTAYQNLRLCPGGGNVTLNSATFLPTSPSTAGNLALTGTLAMGSSFQRNKLINGGFDVWQRGTSQSFTGYGSADRWYNVCAGTTTVSQDTSIPTGVEVQYSIKWVTGASTSYGQFYQCIEQANVIPLRGKTVTVSGYVKTSNYGSGNLLLRLYYSNSSDSFAVVSTGTVLVDAVIPGTTPTSWTRYSATVAIPSDAVGLAAALIPDTVQGSGVSVWMTGVQVELGSIATPFERRLYGAELALCQRYLPYFAPGAWLSGQAISATQAYITCPFSVTARVNPTGIATSTISGSNFITYTPGGAGINVTAMVFGGVGGTNSALLVPTVASGMTAGNATSFLNNGGASFFYFTGCEL